VTNFQNNPQHVRVLANEMFAIKLRMRIGPPVGQFESLSLGVEHLIGEMSKRKREIRRLISEFRNSSRHPFPNRTETVSFAVLQSNRDRELEIR
jgi:hypothetical protein